MENIIYIAMLIVSFILLVRKNDDSEPYFPLKIIGYFLLGSFAFKFNEIPLPLGFVVYLWLFRPKLNVNVKRKAAVFGVFAFILAWTLPYFTEKWENRPTYIEHQLGSVYTTNFQNENDLVMQELKLNYNSLRLEDFKVDYNIDGKITNLGWQLIEQKGSGYNLYQISYSFRNNKYCVLKGKSDTWLQYNRLIEVNLFFQNLNKLNIKDITVAKGDYFSFGIRSTGERTDYEMRNKAHFVIANEGIQSLDDENLPVEAYYISTYAMKKTDEVRDKRGNITQQSFEGTKSSDYLFEVQSGDE